MKGYVTLDYDAEKNIVFTIDHWDIATPGDVDEFFAEHVKHFEQIGRKFYMISNIDNLSIHPSVLEYYGETARKTVGHYLLGFARWGSNDLARMSIRTSSMKARLESHVFHTRDEAVQYIDELKRTGTEFPPPEK